MGIRRIFSQAAPSPDWAAGPLHGSVVALMHCQDWRPWLDDALALLDPVEAARMQRKRRPEDREVLTLCYALHRLLLARVLGLDPLAVPVWRDGAGCPRVGDNLVSTSLSHADGWIALAVCGQGPVGVDVESFSRLQMLPEIVDSICHPTEKDALAGLSIEAYQKALLAIWVRKEALLKAAGVGLSREMNSFAAPVGVLPLGPESSLRTSLQMLQAGPDCLGAVAAPPGAPLLCARLVPRR